LQLRSNRQIAGHQVDQVAYRLEFSENANGFVILNERLANTHAERKNGGVYLDRASFNFSPTESLLSQYKNPADKTPVTEVGKQLARIKIFREFKTGPQSAARYGTSTSIAKDGLLDGGDNLALVLLDLDFLGAHDGIQSYLRRFCERFDDVKVDVGQGLARTFLREAGLQEMLSAIRMSDGTLKFLSLLARFFIRPDRGLCVLKSLRSACIPMPCS
jgi:predicted ATPase